MTSQPWIPGGAGGGCVMATALQWSHDLSAMDTADIVDVCETGYNPSMEP